MGRVELVWAMFGAGLCASAVGALGCASDPESGGGAGTSAVTSNEGSGDGGAAGSRPGTAGMGAAPSDETCSALPPPANMDDLISNFEEGLGTVQQVAGRGGGFYMFNDGTGTQTPPTGDVPPARAIEHCTSKYALCMKGSGFMTWGAGMGTDLAPQGPPGADGMPTKLTYDASKFTGVAFWAKAEPGSATAVRIGFKDKNTAPEGGVCDAKATSGPEQCNDDWGKNLSLTTDWQAYKVTFAELKQSGWGKASPAFAADAVYSVQYQVMQGMDFDVCIDDLMFTR